MDIQVATTKKCHPKRRRSSNRYCIFNYPWNGAPCNRKNDSRFTNSLDLRVEDITSNSALDKYKILAKSAIEGCLLKVYSGSHKDRLEQEMLEFKNGESMDLHQVNSILCLLKPHRKRANNTLGLLLRRIQHSEHYKPNNEISIILS